METIKDIQNGLKFKAQILGHKTVKTLTVFKTETTTFPGFRYQAVLAKDTRGKVYILNYINSVGASSRGDLWGAENGKGYPMRRL